RGPLRRVQGPPLRSPYAAQADGLGGVPGQEVGPRVLPVRPVTKAIDLHVHLPMDEWLDNAIGPLLPATEAYFRAKVARKSIEEVAEEYASRDILGVVLDWDDRSVTGRGWMGNDWLAGLSGRFPGVLMGFGSVDPHREDALDEMRRAHALGLKGLKFHPTMQRFDPSDERFAPLWASAEELGLVCLFHTGTC